MTMLTLYERTARHVRIHGAERPTPDPVPGPAVVPEPRPMPIPPAEPPTIPEPTPDPVPPVKLPDDPSRPADPEHPIEPPQMPDRVATTEARRQPAMARPDPAVPATSSPTTAGTPGTTARCEIGRA